MLIHDHPLPLTPKKKPGGRTAGIANSIVFADCYPPQSMCVSKELLATMSGDDDDGNAHWVLFMFIHHCTPAQETSGAHQTQNYN